MAHVKKANAEAEAPKLTVEKKPYATPRIRRLGSVRELTQTTHTNLH